MNYDRIILELIDRVAALEEEVKALKNAHFQSAENIDLPKPNKVAAEPNKPYGFTQAYNGRDSTKYIFDGVRYGKNRLVLAIVKKYAASHNDISADDLMSTFDRSLQGSLGVVRTVQDIKNSYADSERRFFLRPDEIINTTTEPCAVCSQWGSFNINNIIARAKELGMTITEI